MSKKSNLMVILIVLLLIMFLGVVAAVVAINYAKIKVSSTIKNEITEGKKETDEITDKKAKELESISARQTYSSKDGSWQLMYPVGWIEKEIDQNTVWFKESEILPQSEDRGSVSVNVIANKSIDEIISVLNQDYDQVSTKKVLAGGKYGTQYSGTLKDNVPSMMQAGTPILITYFELDNGKILSLELNNPGQKFVYDNIIELLQFNAGSSKQEKSVGTKSSSGNIVVYTPNEKEKLVSPYVLTGKARVFENVVNYKLSDDSGHSLAEGTITANAADVGQFGDFSTSLFFITSAKKGTLEVYSMSPKDGSVQDKVEIGVIF